MERFRRRPNDPQACPQHPSPKNGGARKEWRRFTVGVLAVVMGGVAGACGDDSIGPVGPVLLPPGLVSRIDGKPLDEAKLKRFREIGQGCTFTTQDFAGGYRRVALRRSELPFTLRPIRANPATGLGDGKFMSVVVRSPSREGTVSVGCYVPSAMTAVEFGDAVAGAQAGPRWRKVLDQLVLAPGVTETELRRPLSPEAREFLYEMAPSAISRSSPDISGLAVVVGPGMQSSWEVTVQCKWGHLMNNRAPGADYTADDFSCTCGIGKIWNVSQGTSDDFTWCEVEYTGGGDGWPSFSVSDPPSSGPSDYGQEADKGGYWTNPPAHCQPPAGEPPPEEIPEDSLGRQYFRSPTLCLDSLEKPPVPSPTPLPWCDPGATNCLKPMTVGDREMLRRVVSSWVDLTVPVCANLSSKLLEYLNSPNPAFALYRGDSTVPDVGVSRGMKPHLAYTDPAGNIHIDEEVFVRAMTDTLVAQSQRDLAVVALHEVVHSLGIHHDDVEYPYPNTPPYNQILFDQTSPGACVPYR